MTDDKLIDAILIETRNLATSRKEVEDFLSEKPVKYFCYVKEGRPDALVGGGACEFTTWMGDKLGHGFFEKPFRSSFGDERSYVRCTGINGVVYWGWYYCSTGDYCRLYAFKHQEAVT